MFLQRHKIRKRSVHFNDTLLFVFGVVSSVLLPQILVAVISGSTALLFTLFVSWSLGAMLGFASYVLKIRSFQERETFRLLKTQHKEFFRQIRSNVAHLLDKA